MGRKRNSNIVVNELDYKKPKYLNSDTCYKVWQLEKIKGYSIFVAHLIQKDPLKVTNFKEYYELQEDAVKDLVNDNSNITKTNSIIFFIFELKKGIKFLPDISMFNYSLCYKKSLKRKYNIKFGGGIVLINPEVNSKSYKTFQIVKQIYGKFEHFELVTNLKDAFQAIHSFSKAFKISHKSTK